MSVNKTPGVYVQEITKLPPSVAEVETAIPAFIGYTQMAKGLNGEDLGTTTPAVLRIVSMLEYEKHFGGPNPEAYSVTIVDKLTASVLTSREISVIAPVTFNDNSLYYHMQLYFANGGGPCYIVSIGRYADSFSDAKFSDGIKELEKYDEPTLICFPEAFEKFDETKYGSLLITALAQCNKLKDRFVIADVPDVTKFRNESGMNNLKYGAAYYPFINSNLVLGYDETEIDITHNQNIDGEDSLGTGSFDGKKMFEIDQPIIDAIRSKLASFYCTDMAPSSAIAGVYASVDNDRGVWKAPANVSLNSIASLTVKVDDGIQDGLNIDPTAGKSINAIRSFMGKGIMVWGSRTLAGNDNEWRYVPVRRFFNFVEESCQKSTGWAVFEPNDANTWLRVKSQLENFLNNLWRRGALQGAKPEHAYYVSIGLGRTMTAQDVLEGRMIVEIGMAAVRPAEFIILKFSHLLAQS
jgi:uncharacterized protein